MDTNNRTYIFPRLPSRKDLYFFRIGGSGLANCLMINNAQVRTWREPLGSFLGILDIAFTPSSNVIIDALVHGVPTAYVPGLDSFSFDLHGYVAAGIVPEYSDSNRYPESLWDFFSDDSFKNAWAILGYSPDPVEERNTLRSLCCPPNGVTSR